MFNRESRWDQAAPGFVKEGEGLNEPIEVEAYFRAGQVTPKRFSWQGRVYVISKVTYRWADRQGAAVVHHFSVVSGGTLLICHSKTCGSDGEWSALSLWRHKHNHDLLK